VKRPRVTLGSLSAAMDGGFTAIADVSTALTGAGATAHSVATKTSSGTVFVVELREVAPP
jgi:hypothetical protein